MAEPRVETTVVATVAESVVLLVDVMATITLSRRKQYNRKGTIRRHIISS